jgi:hypothetical protein
MISIVIASEHVGTVISAVEGIINITHIPTTKINIIHHIAAIASTCKHNTIIITIITIVTIVTNIIKHIIISILPIVSCIVKRITSIV